MGDRSKIEWTDATWNPVTGCMKVSAGCKYCYAERLVGRFDKLHGFVPFEKVECHADRLEQPMRWKKPRRIFVVSLGDLFHEQVPADFIQEVFEVMSACPQHTFQVLTKRPERIGPVLFGEEGRFYLGGGDYLPNVWIGTSIEDQSTADRRIPLLMASGWIGVTWVSVEPMLGPVDLSSFLSTFRGVGIHNPQWIVLGGESGPKARPMHPEWVRSVRDQCVAAGVPFLFKQWGEFCPPSQMPEDTFQRWDVHHGTETGINREASWRCGKKAAGRLLDGDLWDQYPTGSSA